MTLDNYTAVYGADETSEVAIDMLVTIFSAMVGFGTLIALVLIFKWMKKNTNFRM